MTPRPSSPTSYLWAHQFKRENGHILDRVRKLEASTEQHADRLKSTEASVKASISREVVELAKQVKALDDSGVTTRLATMEGRLGDVEAENEAMTLQIASLEKNEAQVAEEKRQAFSTEKALLKRVGEVEENLRKYETKLEEVGRRVHEGQMGEIKSQLENLTKQVRREGGEMKHLSDSLAVLEKANVELVKANERLAEEVQKLAERRVSAPASTPAKLIDGQSEVGAEETSHSQTKKSHKWVGGGADKDIIRQGSDVVERIDPGTPQSTPVDKSLEKSKTTKSHLIQKRPTAYSTAPRNAYKSTSGRVSEPQRRSKKWIGGRADTETFHQGPSSLKSSHKATSGRPSEPSEKAQSESSANKKASLKPTTKGVANPVRKQPKVFDGDKSKPIVRSGKGWVEYAYTPTEEEMSQEAAPPVKRPRGRPRKNTQPSQDVDEDTQRRTRGVSQHLKESKSEPGLKKRYRGEEEDPAPNHGCKPSATLTELKVAQNKHYDKARLTSEPGALSSPMSSLPLPRRSVERSPAGRTLEGALLGAITSQPNSEAQADEPASKRRRIIEQEDDGDLLEQYQNSCS